MKKVIIISPLKGVVVNPPNGAYHEEVKIGRYIVHAIFLPEEIILYVFRGDELKAIISNNNEWYISKIDGECQNLLNRLLSIYG